MSVKPGPGFRVCLSFSLRLEDGTEVDGTGDGEPWCPVLGDGSLVPAIEQAVGSLSVGERQTFVFGALDAYGMRDETLVYPIATTDFPDEVQIAPGTVVAFATPAGEEVPGLILEHQGSHVLVDFNHPLAGHTVVFDVALLSAEPAEVSEQTP